MHQVAAPALETAEHNGEQSSSVNDGPLFVVGIWRSGTSLFYALLNQHPQVALMYEDDIVFLRSLFWVPRKTSNWLAKWDFFNGAITRHKVDGSHFPENISDLKTALETVHIEYCRQKKGATIWGCKSPTYFDVLSQLRDTFPKAKFIIIWRDLTSICRSIEKAAEEPSFFSRKGITLRALLGYRELKLQCDWLLKHGAPVCQVHYEELVRDPATVMEGVCKFLQIPFDPRMTLLEGADRSAIEEAGHHSLVKSKEILGARARSSGPSPALKAKVERYTSMWREQEGGSWPVYPKAPESTTSPSVWERARDRLAYRTLWLWYYMIPVAYSAVPLAIWKNYRKLTRRSFSWNEDSSSGQ
jgi:Sulfotransferase family